MMTKYSIGYFVNGQHNHKYCDSKKDASNFARKVSKGGRAYIYRVTGSYIDGVFYEHEGVYVADYIDGKRK